jgi:hypothetical protein
MRRASHLNDGIRVGSVGLRRRGHVEVEAEVQQESERERRGGHR